MPSGRSPLECVPSSIHEITMNDNVLSILLQSWEHGARQISGDTENVTQLTDVYTSTLDLKK